MKAGLLIFFFSVFFAGCKSRNKIPKNILPQAKMEAVMWDMIRADKFLTDFVLIKDTSLNKDTSSIQLYQQIFRIHHISKEEFQRSFSFYRAHPVLLKTVLDSLDARPNKITPEQAYKPKPIIDISRHLKDSLKSRKKIKKLPLSR
jgi:hypothetical protein